MNILVFAPHPDDDIIGCGGSIALHHKKGDTITVVYMTSGDAGSLDYSKEELTKLREEEAKQAGKIIGIEQQIFLRNEDGYISYSKELLITLMNIIREQKPDIVYIPHEKDNHKDHQITYEIAIEAIRRSPANSFQEGNKKPWTVSTILCYEVWTPLQKITYAENITDVMPIKLEALKKHTSQIANVPYHEAVQGLNRYRGAMLRKGTFAECFQILQIDRIR